MSTRYNTGNPIESTDVRDMSDNAKNFDEFSNSMSDSFTDRLGIDRQTIEGSIRKAGFQPSSFDFVTGGTLFSGDRNRAVFNPTPSGDNNWYAWQGSLPKTITPNSTPETSGGFADNAWKPVTNTIEYQMLRYQLSSVDGSSLIGSGSYADISAYTGTNTVINVYGKSNIFDGGYGVFRLDAADTTSADNGGTILVDALGRRWKRVFLGPVQSKWFCVGDGVADDTTQLQKAVNYSISKKIPLHLNKGDYKYSSLDLTGITSGSVISGDGSLLARLVYTGTGGAFVIDAFYSGSPTAPFIHSIELGGFSIIGTNATKLFVMQGVARSKFKDIKVNGASVGNTSSIAFEFKGVMLSTFDRVMCSYEFGATPYRGLVLDEGRRAGVSVGGCSNNVFISAYLEGNAIGVQLKDNGADQNTFIGGSPESCTSYGLLVGTGCRYNTFIGVGFENLGATADVVDSGISSEYLNCYSSKSFIVDSTNRSIRVKGGFFERFQINSGAKGQDIRDIVVNHWNTGSGGFVNNGVGLRFNNIWDADQSKFIYPLKDRVAVTVGASPYTILNDELVPIKFRVYGGTVEIVQVLRGTDSWIEPNPSASGGGTGTTGVYIIMPGESLRINYSSAPTVNKILLNNI